MAALTSVNPGCSITSLEDPSRNAPPRVIVFDFGGGVGRVNKKRIIEVVTQELTLPGKNVKNLLKQVKKWKGPMQVFWDNFAKSEPKAIPQNWSEKFDKLELEAIEINSGTLKIVKELRPLGYTTALLSNAGKARARLMKKSGYDQEFDPAVSLM